MPLRKGWSVPRETVPGKDGLSQIQRFHRRCKWRAEEGKSQNTKKGGKERKWQKWAKKREKKAGTVRPFFRKDRPEFLRVFVFGEKKGFLLRSSPLSFFSSTEQKLQRRAARSSSLERECSKGEEGEWNTEQSGRWKRRSQQGLHPRLPSGARRNRHHQRKR